VLHRGAAFKRERNLVLHREAAFKREGERERERGGEREKETGYKKRFSQCYGF
jgi:hypothetical protein